MIGDFDIIQREFEETLVYSQSYPFDIDATNLLQDWAVAKRPIIEKFGGRTIWRSERPIKIQLSEELRRRRFQEFIDELDLEDIFTNEELYDFFRDNAEGFFENRTIKDFPSKNIKKGSKLLKSIKKFENDQFRVRFIQDTASRYIQEDKIEGYLFLSVDPRDFLTLSENNSKWTSCHSLDGDYRAGNLSYMVDESTIIAYISSGNKEHLRCMPKGTKWIDKKWRMLVHSNWSTNIYYNRQYPFTHQGILDMVDRVVKDLFFHKQYFTEPVDIGIRKVVLPTGEDVDLGRNYFFNGEKVYDSKDIICDKDNLGYTDMIRSSVYSPIVAVSKEALHEYIEAVKNEEGEDEEFKHIYGITIGAPVICPCCGEEMLKRDDKFLCDDCIVENDADMDFYCLCSGCGRHIYDEDSPVMIGDELYCEQCAENMEDMIDSEEEDF